MTHGRSARGRTLTKDTEAVLDMPLWSARDTPLERVSRVTRHLVIDGKQEIDRQHNGGYDRRSTGRAQHLCAVQPRPPEAHDSSIENPDAHGVVQCSAVSCCGAWCSVVYVVWSSVAQVPT